MASEPNIQQYVESAVAQTVEQLKSALANPIAEVQDSILASLEAHRNEARRIDTYLEERAQRHLQAIQESVALVEERIGQTIAGISSSIDDRIAAYHSAAEAARSAAVEAARAAEEAKAAGEAIQLRTAEADRAEAAARERIAEAEQAEERAKRAVALVKAQGDLMVEQSVKEQELKLREKEVLAQLKREREELEDKFDELSMILGRELDEYYGDVRQRIEKVLAEGDDAEAEDETDAGSSDEEAGE